MKRLTRFSRKQNVSLKNITRRNMNNKTKFSVLAVAKEKFVALRKKYGIKNKYTMTEIAQKAGLPVEYLKNRSANLVGYLDWNPTPRFIAVNSDLPAHEQVWFIAQQI